MSIECPDGSILTCDDGPAPEVQPGDFLNEQTNIEAKEAA